MSKSEENPNGVISMFDSRDAIIKKIKGATTDSEMIVKYDEENKPGISNLLNIASSITGKNIDELEKMFENKNYGEFKAYVADVVSNHICNIQEKYNALLDSNEVNKILDVGIEKSRKLAKEKYELIRERIGLNIGR